MSTQTEGGASAARAAGSTAEGPGTAALASAGGGSAPSGGGNAPATSPADEASAARGFGFALSAYLFWGFLPFYMKAVAHIPSAEVVAHRIVWSVPIAAAVLWATGRLGAIGAVLRSPRMLAMGTLTAVLVTLNWGIYVWAIAVGRALETALGYYVNPLFSVFLGAAVLGERLTRLQTAAIALAAIAVALLALESGGLPWVSVGLAVSWGFYALCKRALPIGATEGFFLEVTLLSPFAAIYILWLEGTGVGHFLRTGLSDNWLLLGCGFVTAVPLLLYANGAKLLKLSTIAMMQYIAPTMIFLTAVFVFREPFGIEQAVAFLLIWTALGLYSWSVLAARRVTSSG